MCLRTASGEVTRQQLIMLFMIMHDISYTNGIIALPVYLILITIITCWIDKYWVRIIV